MEAILDINLNDKDTDTNYVLLITINDNRDQFKYTQRKYDIYNKDNMYILVTTDMLSRYIIIGKYLFVIYNHLYKYVHVSKIENIHELIDYIYNDGFVESWIRINTPLWNRISSDLHLREYAVISRVKSALNI